MDSWQGRHWQVIGSGLITTSALSSQLQDAKITSAAEGVATSAVAFALIMVISSSASLLCHQISPRAYDPNFRYAVMLKALLLEAKTILLTFPEQSSTVDVRYLWSCVQQLCPDWCTSKLRGYCAAVSGQCRCHTLTPDIVVLVLTIVTSLVVGTLTLVDIIPVIWRRQRPQDTREHIGILLCNCVYVIVLLLIVISPITVYSQRAHAAGVFALPLLPLSLLVNENKWIIHGLRGGRSDVPAIGQRGGLRIILCTFWALVLVAIVVLGIDIMDMGMQPVYTQPFDGQFMFVAHFGIATWIGGALASLLLI